MPNPYITLTDANQFQIGHTTHAGRSGKNNEDNYSLFETRYVSADRALIRPVQIAVVADGIGGHAGGEKASQITIDTMVEALLDAETMPLLDRMENAVQKANDEIYLATQTQPALQGMGTTIVAVAILEDTLFITHAGDSRAYLIRAGKAHLLTLDHSWAQEAIDAGRLKPDEAKHHPNRNVIKRFLGVDADVEIDHTILDPAQKDAEYMPATQRRMLERLALEPGDALLLCSDGLTDVVNAQMIENIVTRYDPQQATKKLIDRANAAGGPDNITAVILKKPGGSPPPVARRTPAIAAVLGVLALLLLGGFWRLFASGGISLPGVTQNPTPTTTPIAVAVAISPTLSAALVTTPTVTTPPVANSMPVTETSPTESVATSTITTSFATPTLATTANVTVATSTVLPPTSTPVSEISKTVSNDIPTAVATPSAAAIAQASAYTNTTTSTATATTSSLGKPTSTPLPDNTNTPLPTATPTPVPPTSTPVRTVTPTTTTATPIPTFTPATPKPSSTSKSPDTEPACPSGACSVTLMSPDEGNSSSGRQEFRWQPNFNPQRGQAFEVVFWKAGQDPMIDGKGFGGTSDYAIINIDCSQQTAGEYLWGVLLVKTTPSYERLAYLGGARRFIIQAAGGDSPKPNSPAPKTTPHTK